MSGDQFILDDPQDVPALWGSGTHVLWPEGEALMLASMPGLCKTTLAGLLVRAQLGLGDGKVLGLPVREIEGNILYLAMDRPPQIGRSMSRQFTEADREVLKRRLVVRKGPLPNDLATDPEMLLAVAREHNASVVYVDSLKDAVIGLTDDKTAAAYNRARQTLTAAGIQLCELHHCRKMLQGNEQSKALSEIYGSIWLTAGAGSVILLTGESGDVSISFEHVKPVLETVGPWRLIHDQKAGQVRVDASADLLDVLKASGPDGITIPAAASHLFDTDKPTRAQTERARRKLDKYADEGRAIACGGIKGGPPATYYAT
ncbi:hypothetical protein A5782_08530 [Mycobacterium sp. 852002-40037_SCH5390672]|nr:hypothetical protein A5782_08530 [Mycobacterium sp. 852002-40037_SCH5390672]